MPRILGALVALAAVAVTAVLAFGGDDSEDDDAPRQRRSVDIKVTTAALANDPTTTVVGIFEGEPLGRISADIRRRVKVPPRPSGPAVPFTADVTLSSSSGSIQGKLVGTVRVDGRGASTEKARLTISGGTGEYEGIEGSIRTSGTSPAGPVSHLAGTGSVEY